MVRKMLRLYRLKPSCAMMRALKYHKPGDVIEIQIGEKKFNCILEAFELENYR